MPNSFMAQLGDGFLRGIKQAAGKGSRISARGAMAVARSGGVAALLAGVLVTLGVMSVVGAVVGVIAILAVIGYRKAMK